AAVVPRTSATESQISLNSAAPRISSTLDGPLSGTRDGPIFRPPRPDAADPHPDPGLMNTLEGLRASCNRAVWSERAAMTAAWLRTPGAAPGKEDRKSTR